ncbi:Transcription activator [Homalodisca vitripennis]|nr:Transcription activator [Homalodisca vitripennis]
MCHLNLGNLMDVQERHITNRKCRDSGVQGLIDRSSLLREMIVGVDGVLASLNKGVPPPAYFDWRGWFRAGGGPYPQPYPSRISRHSGSSTKVPLGLSAISQLLGLREQKNTVLIFIFCVSGEQEVRVLTLAEQIIAAMPDRIKNESEDMMLLLSNQSVEVMESPLLLDEPPSSSSSCCFDTNNEFNFDHNYRYYDVSTPSSSLSPASSSCLPSPSPSSFALPDSPSPPPTTADFCEFFHASSNSLFFEKDFSNLTLSDREQRELYEAAKIIQKAYRSYKGRKKLEEQDKERAAAILIQNYYRRYKQYAYFKQMTRAAMVIQNGFRSYCEHKRFKKNQEAAVRIQNYYRNYRDQGRAGESTPPTGLKRTYSQRRQHQAARKIQQFMRQSKNNVWEISPGTMVTERTSRKREAGGPMSQGCPSKVILSRQFTFHRTK